MDFVGLVQCSGYPTNVAPGIFLEESVALVAYGIGALHFSHCTTVLCRFLENYEKQIRNAYLDLTIVPGTHQLYVYGEIQEGSSRDALSDRSHSSRHERLNKRTVCVSGDGMPHEE